MKHPKSILEKVHPLKGLLGFSVGTLSLVLLFYFELGGRKSSPFHEINWDSRAMLCDITSSLLEDQKYIESLAANRALFDSLHNTGTDTSSQHRLKRIRKDYLQHIMNLRDSALTATDAELSVAAARTVSLVPGSYNLDNLDTKDSLDVLIRFRTNRVPGLDIQMPYRLKVSRGIIADEFFAKHPTFGLWAALMIFQQAFFLLLIFWLPYKLFEPYINGKVGPYTPSVSMIHAHWICCVLVCLIFYYVLMVADGNVIAKPQYFMCKLKPLFGVTSFLGYAAAGLSISGMLLIYVVVRKVKNETVAGLFKEREEQYRAAEEQFDHYFTILATILTFGTLTASSLFSALNTLPFVQEVARSQGHSPFPPEFVLLYGIVHSVVLLVVYVQIRTQLKELAKNLKVEESTAANISFHKKLIELIITSGPLLGPLLQVLLEIV